MFEKSLGDLIKGIRAHKRDEAEYIARCMEEIKTELRTTNPKLKSQAVLKLTYLYMLGYDVSWAAFQFVECMSLPKFSHKRIGYLAASLTFDESTDVILLTTNLLKKELNSPNPFECCLALNTLANIVTEDLARDVVADVLRLTDHSDPTVRKRATLSLFRIFLEFPDALRPSFAAIQERMKEENPSVACAAVNVVCELARKNPKNYLGLAPVFYRILTSSANNWMLIKVMKLVGVLCPLEPRLSKKLVKPVSNIMNNTSAKSLLYESIVTVSNGMMEHEQIVQLALSKLGEFLSAKDQNLRYLALVAIGNFQRTSLALVAPFRSAILSCLDDPDRTIRLRALDIVTGMISQDNLVDIIQLIVNHIRTTDGAFRNTLVEKVVQACCQGTYVHVTDFAWYISVLADLAVVPNNVHGVLIRDELINVAVRVKGVRNVAVATSLRLLGDERLYRAQTEQANACQVLHAAAFICGEFGTAEDIESVTIRSALSHVLRHETAHVLPGSVQAVFVQGALKLSIALAGRNETVAPEGGDADAAPAADNANAVFADLAEQLAPFAHSEHLEAQERAVAVQQLARLMAADATLVQALTDAIAEDLPPVAPKAQRKVPVPDGLDLDTPLRELPEDSDDEESWEGEDAGPAVPGAPSAGSTQASDAAVFVRMSEAEREAAASVHREELERRRAMPFYLGGAAGAGKESAPGSPDSVDNIPIISLTDSELGIRPGGAGSAASASLGGGAAAAFEVDRSVAMPGAGGPGAVSSQSGAGAGDDDDSDDEVDGVLAGALAATGVRAKRSGSTRQWKHKKLDMDVSQPLGAHERLPEVQQYSASARGAVGGMPMPFGGAPTHAQPLPHGGNAPQAAAPVRPVKLPSARQVVLCDSSALKATAELRPHDSAFTADGSEAGSVPSFDFVVLFKNAGSEALSQFAIAIEGESTAIAAIPKDSGKDPLTFRFSLEAGAKKKIKVGFHLANDFDEDSQAIARVPLRLSFVAGAQEDGSEPNTEVVETTIEVPVSLFLTPKAVDTAAFSSIVSSPDCANFSAATIPLRAPPQAVIPALAARLGLHVVESVGSAASLYGISQSGAHIAALAKADAAGRQLKIDFKSTDATLGKLLAREAEEMMRSAS